VDPMRMISNRFMYEADGSGGGSGGNNPPTDPPKTSPSTPPANPPADPPAKKEMTQAELDTLIAGAKKEGGEKLWRKYGFDNEKAFDDFLTTSKAEAEAKKSETQKEKDAREAAEKREKEALARADKAEAKAEALALGVPADKADRFIKLAMTYEGDTVQAKVKAALTENPEFKGQAAQQIPSQNNKVRNQMSSTMAAADAELDKVFGSRQKS
jgi:hypothetical protein